MTATPSQRRTWDYWSVPGLLDIIEADLARAEDSPPGSVRLFAEFDATYGYPRPLSPHRVQLDGQRRVERRAFRARLVISGFTTEALRTLREEQGGVIVMYESAMAASVVRT
ncbi:MAG: hypothetical protein R3C10_16645 [Pirellulales bacterium]